MRESTELHATNANLTFERDSVRQSITGSTAPHCWVGRPSSKFYMRRAWYQLALFVSVIGVVRCYGMLHLKLVFLNSYGMISLTKLVPASHSFVVGSVPLLMSPHLHFPDSVALLV